MPQLTVPLPLVPVPPSPLHTLSCSSACLARITLGRLSFAARTLDSHFSVATRLVHLPHLSRSFPLSLHLSLLLSLSHSLSVQLSAKFIKNKLALGTVLVWLPNSLAVCKQLVSLLSMLFLRLYLAVLCLISER